MIVKLGDVGLWLVLLGLALPSVLIAGRFRSAVDLETRLTGIDRHPGEIQAQISEEQEQYAQIKNELRRTRQEFCEALNTGQCGERNDCWISVGAC